MRSRPWRCKCCGKIFEETQDPIEACCNRCFFCCEDEQEEAIMEWNLNYSKMHHEDNETTNATIEEELKIWRAG